MRLDSLAEAKDDLKSLEKARKELDENIEAYKKVIAFMEHKRTFNGAPETIDLGEVNKIQATEFIPKMEIIRSDNPYRKDGIKHILFDYCMKHPEPIDSASLVKMVLKKRSDISELSVTQGLGDMVSDGSMIRPSKGVYQIATIE